MMLKHMSLVMYMVLLLHLFIGLQVLTLCTGYVLCAALVLCYFYDVHTQIILMFLFTIPFHC